MRPRLIVNTAEAAIDAAKDGLGIVRVLSYQAETCLADKSLRIILEAFEPEPIPVNLIHREDRLPQAKVQSFIAFAAPRLRQALKERVPPRGGSQIAVAVVIDVIGIVAAIEGGVAGEADVAAVVMTEMIVIETVVAVIGMVIGAVTSRLSDRRRQYGRRR